MANNRNNDELDMWETGVILHTLLTQGPERLDEQARRDDRILALQRLGGYFREKRVCIFCIIYIFIFIKIEFIFIYL